MKRGQWLSAMLVATLAALLTACGGSSSTKTTVTVFPTAAVVVLGGTQQFSARVSGPSDTTVTWSVAGSACNGTGCGTISTNGLYTAPDQIFSPNTVTVKATSKADTTASATASITIDSGVRVTVSPATASLATGEQIVLTATVTGTAPNNNLVNWTVNGTANGDTVSGLICAIGSNPCAAPAGPVDSVYYLAPAAAPSGTVKVTATAVADSTQLANASLTVLAAVDPVIGSISPTTAAQGSAIQDVYINAQSPSNFFSTSTVLANGAPIATTFISKSLLRGRLPASFMQSGHAIQIAVEGQNGHISNTVGLQVAPVKPAILSYSPISVPQCLSGSCGPVSVTLDGGYFSPSTVVQFNGQTIGAAVNTANQMRVSLPGSVLQSAGLYQLTLTNPGAAQPEAAVNVAVEPDVASSAPAVVATVPVGTQPSAAAVNPATGELVVVNTGSNSLSLLNVNNCNKTACPESSVPVGNQPTGLSIDPLRNLAYVVNQADDTLSVVDLSGTNATQTIPLPGGYVPVSIGVNPLTQHAVVANQETNAVTMVDLSQSPPAMTAVDLTQGGTRPGGTGANPHVVIEPRLDWAIVTPGGNGSISAIDMSHPTVDVTTGAPTFEIIFSYTLSTSVTGVALDPSDGQLLFADPNSASATAFSLLDQSTKGVTNVGFDNAAAAINPLTNVGVVANEQSDVLTLIDLTTGNLIGTSTSSGGATVPTTVTVGGKPVDLAMDPVTDQVATVNQTDGTISLVSLGGVRPLSLTQAMPARLFNSTSPQTVTLLGGGFTSGSQVRIDGAALAASAVQVLSSRALKVTLPVTALSGPRMLNLDVQNTDGTLSSVEQIPVVQAVQVGVAPVAVAVDSTHNLAVVTNSTSNTASVVDLSTGQVTATVNVGANPQTVGVIPRLDEAVVANTGDNTASIIDLTTNTATSAALSSNSGSAQGPIAMDINQDTAMAAIANQQSNNVSLVDVSTGFLSTQFQVDQGPLGIAIDPQLGVAAVLCATQSPPTVDLADLTTSPVTLTSHIIGPDLPIGVALDPTNDLFFVADSTGNRILVVDPQQKRIVQNVATGINPTAIAYNPEALEAVTVNYVSHTASVLEMTPTGSAVRALLVADGSSQQSVAINTMTNLAVVADQANNRILLIPLPH